MTIVFIEIRLKRRLICTKHDAKLANKCIICNQIGPKQSFMKRLAWEVLLQNDLFHGDWLFSDFQMETVDEKEQDLNTEAHHWMKEIYAIAGECSLIGEMTWNTLPFQIPELVPKMSATDEEQKVISNWKVKT